MILTSGIMEEPLDPCLIASRRMVFWVSVIAVEIVVGSMREFVVFVVGFW